MKRARAFLAGAALTSLAAALLCVAPLRAAPQTALALFAAGTLAVPFTALDDAFQREHPDVVVQAQFGGSVLMTKKITELHQPADVLAVADYSVIPKYLFGEGEDANADWYAGFAGNAITFVYTDKSKYASEISADNWYRYLSRPGVQIGRSDPDTDPSGYQTLQMLALAERYYRKPGLAENVLANAPRQNTRDTETSLISALQLGQIDYLAIYRSDALQYGLKYLDLPAAINLSDGAHAADYAQISVHTKNGDLVAKPIVYAVTVPGSAEHPDQAKAYVAFLLGAKGQEIMAADGFAPLRRALAVGADRMPAELRPLVTAWPSSNK